MIPPDLVVAEVFGPTFQGEGPATGTRCMFLRLGRCNLACQWCDTPYSWDWTGKLGRVYVPAQELHRLSVDAAVAVVLDSGCRVLVVTGGEPLLQATAVEALARRLHQEGVRMHVETNGTRPPLDLPGELRPLYVVSPKLANSGMQRGDRLRPDTLRHLVAHGAHLKFVVEGPADLEEVARVVELSRVPGRHVWVMPEGTTEQAVLQRMQLLAGPVLDRGWNLSTRLHVLLWGQERGR